MNPGASRQRKNPSPRPMCRILFDPLCLCCSYNRQSFESKERERCSSLFLFRPVPLSQLGRSPLGQSRLSVMARSYRVFGFFLFLFLSPFGGSLVSLAFMLLFVQGNRIGWGAAGSGSRCCDCDCRFCFSSKEEEEAWQHV